MPQKGILKEVTLPAKDFSDQWDKIIVPEEIKTRLLCQALLELTVREHISAVSVPLHGIILLAGPPGTGKTSLARGLANRVADSLKGPGLKFIEVEPHALASANLGRSQQSVRDLLQKTISEHAAMSPLIVLLDEIETLAPDRRRLSLEANPFDVHRATDAVLAGIDQLAISYPRLLFLATTNFREAVDEALLSRVDLVVWIDKPPREACAAILSDTLTALAGRWPALKTLEQEIKNSSLPQECVGLDARQIRKSVVAACTFSKECALNPGLLTLKDLLRAIRAMHREDKRQ